VEGNEEKGGGSETLKIISKMSWDINFERSFRQHCAHAQEWSGRER